VCVRVCLRVPPFCAHTGLELSAPVCCGCGLREAGHADELGRQGQPEPLHGGGGLQQPVCQPTHRALRLRRVGLRRCVRRPRPPPPITQLTAVPKGSAVTVRNGHHLDGLGVLWRVLPAGTARSGIPAWLGLKEGVQFRCTNTVWQAYMQQFFQEVVDQLTPYFAVNGGPIVVVQVCPCRVRGAGCWVLGAGCGVRGAGCGVRGVGCGVRDGQDFACCPCSGVWAVRIPWVQVENELPPTDPEYVQWCGDMANKVLTPVGNPPVIMCNGGAYVVG
jgi:hypothetical protein